MSITDPSSPGKCRRRLPDQHSAEKQLQIAKWSAYMFGHYDHNSEKINNLVRRSGTSKLVFWYSEDLCCNSTWHVGIVKHVSLLPGQHFCWYRKDVADVLFPLKGIVLKRLSTAQGLGSTHLLQHWRIEQNAFHDSGTESQWMLLQACRHSISSSSHFSWTEYVTIKSCNWNVDVEQSNVRFGYHKSGIDVMEALPCTPTWRITYNYAYRC